GLFVVGGAHADRAGDVRLRPHGPLPRLRSVLGGAGERRDSGARSLGEGSGGEAVSGIGARARSAADRGGESRGDHAGGGGDPRGVRISGNGRASVRVRERSAGSDVSAAQLSKERRG